MTKLEQLQFDMTKIRSSYTTISNILSRELVKSTYAISALANVLDEGILVLNQRFKVLVANQPALTMLGADREKIIGIDLQSEYPELRLDEPSKVPSDWTVVDTSSGLIRYLELSVSRLNNEDPAEPYLIIMLRDVTFKKSKEFKVLDLSSFQNSLIASIPVPTFYTDNSGGYVRGSQSFFDLVGGNKLQWLSKTVNDLLTPSEAQRFKDLRMQSDSTTCTVHTRDGAQQVVLYKNLLRSQEGEVIGLVGCMVDTSSSQSNIMADILIRALENCPDPLLIISFPECKPFMVNNAFSEAYGYSTQDLIDLGVQEIVDVNDLHRVQREVTQSMQSGSTMKTTFKVNTRSSGLVSEEVTLLPIVRPGQNKSHYCMLVRS